MKKIILNILLILSWQFSIGQQINTSNCSTDFFKKNKNEKTSNSEREIIIPIHWIEVYRDIKLITLLSTNMGKDFAYMKSKNIKLSLKKYEKQIDSVLGTIRKIKVITETEDLVEAEYCYLLHNKQTIAKMDYLIANNETSVGIKKVMDFISQNKAIDHIEIAKVDNLLNLMAKKYDLYKYR